MYYYTDMQHSLKLLHYMSSDGTLIVFYGHYWKQPWKCCQANLSNDWYVYENWHHVTLYVYKQLIPWETLRILYQKIQSTCWKVDYHAVSPDGSERGKTISPTSLWKHSQGIFVFMSCNVMLHLSYNFSWYKGSNVQSDCIVTSAAKRYLASLKMNL